MVQLVKNFSYVQCTYVLYVGTVGGWVYFAYVCGGKKTQHLITPVACMYVCTYMYVHTYVRTCTYMEA